MYTELIRPTIKDSSICVHKTIIVNEKSSYIKHMHNEFEMYLSLEGENVFIVNEKTYKINKGDVIFVNENIVHSTETPSGSRGILIQFLPDDKKDNIKRFLFRLTNHTGHDAVLFKSDDPFCKAIRECLIDIEKENTEKQKGYESFIKADVQKILALLYRSNVLKDPYEFYSSEKIERLFPVLLYIDKNFRSHITLDDASKIISIDKFHFCRIFKRAMNTSFIDYLSFVRVCKAEQFLIRTDKTIGEISEITGFNDSAYFTKIFRKYNECTPSEYRKMKEVR